MKIEIKNFKGIKQYKFDTDAANITVLSGINSGGKTSFIQSLLMIAQSIQEGLDSTPIVLDGKKVKLGSIQNIINHNDNNEKTMIFKFSDSIQNTFKNRIAMRNNNFIRRYSGVGEVKYQISNEKLNNTIGEFIESEYNLEIVIREKNDRVVIDRLSYSIVRTDLKQPITLDFFHDKKLQNDMIKYKIETNNALFLKNYENNSYQISDIFDTFVDTLNKNFINARCKFARIKFNALQPQLESRDDEGFFEIFEHNETKSNETSNIYKQNSVFDLDSFDDTYPTEKIKLDYSLVNLIHSNIKQFFIDIAYIGPLRQFPESLYLKTEDVVKEIGNHGEYAGAILANYYDKNISYPTIDERGEIIPVKGKLINAINYWLCDKFKLAREINVNTYKGKSIYEIELTNLNNNRIPISNVGFGVSQLLPIIILGLFYEKSKLIILEQPEIHLHPSAQSVLFDFIRAISTDKNIIVETHSDHFISRLRRRVIESKEDISKKIKLLFTTNGTFADIEIDKFGYINEWPKGFFDQEEEEFGLMLKARAEKNTDFLKDTDS